MSFFRQIGDSFSNFPAYRGFAAQRGGQTFKYFILLFTLIFVITGVRFAYDFSTNTTQAYNEINEKLPNFTLSGGVLKMEGEQPFVIDPDNNAPFIVDTTGGTDDSVLDRYSEGMFISRDRVVMKQNAQLITLVEFAKFKDVSFDKQQLLNLIPQIRKWALVVMAVFGYVFELVWFLIGTVILALLGMIIASGKKLKLSFGNLWNMAVYAFTLPLLLEMAVQVVYPGLPYFGFVKWGLAGFFLYRAVQAVSVPDGPEQPPVI